MAITGDGLIPRLPGFSDNLIPCSDIGSASIKERPAGKPQMASVFLRSKNNVMLQHLRCPHCGYDLRLLPTDPKDGASVCPECGCAWRLEPDAE